MFTPEGLAGEPAMLVSESGSTLPVQILSDGSAALILDHAAAGECRKYRLEPPAAAERTASSDGMKVTVRNHTLSVYQDDSLVTRYCHSNKYARPFFFPVNAPGGLCVTRSYPMQTVAGETTDHPHHKSLWIAHGDVSGVDNWSEEEGHGHTRQLNIDTIEEGPVLARFGTTSLWCDSRNEPLLIQKLSATFWRGDVSCRLMDFDIQLTANVRPDDLVFGDTKEGGILSVRVASALEAKRGGSIQNVYGGLQEAECWGKHSHWCSYSGEIDIRPCGIAVFDHPDSFRSPTTWHVRDYGLMTANPFGYSAFTNGRTNGSYILRAGSSIAFKYRVIAHNDADFDSKCSARYLDFAFPPQVRVSGAPKNLIP